MEGSVLKQETINEILDGIKELPEDKVQTLMDFFRYLIATSAKKTKQKIRVSSATWKQATEELLSISGIGSSGLGDLSSKHDEYLYGKMNHER
jgi:hypothetical protein